MVWKGMSEHGVKCLHGGEWIDLAGEHGRCGTVL